MVTEKRIKSMKVYMCDECNLFYFDKKNAERCEEWWKDNKSGNLEITRHALKKLFKIPLWTF